MKKIVSITLAVTLFCTLTVTAFATTEFAATDLSSDGIQIQPFYLAINNISAGISINGTQATCSADVETSGAKVNVKLILQRSKNGDSTFSDYSTLHDQTYSKSNVSLQEHKSGLSTSYKYRTKVVVTVYDANGKQIDQGTAYSPAK